MPYRTARFALVAMTGLSACGAGDRPYASSTSATQTPGPGGAIDDAADASTAPATQTPEAGIDASSTPIGSIDGCTVAPTNPNATPQAKKLLCYLYSLYGRYVLSGQQETSWSSDPSEDVKWIRTQTGKDPAILGGDLLYPDGTVARAIDWWNAGGIPMLRYHMGAPPNVDSYDNSKATVADLSAVLAPGTAENASFRAKLEYAAGELLRLQLSGVAVLWAPFHEAQPGGWFWWSKGTGAQYVALWKYMYSYFTNDKGLNNLIWLLPFSGNVNAAFFPGKEAVDLAGPDTYSKSGLPFSSIYKNATNVVGTTIPIPLHETGVVPNPDTMFPGAAPWVLFNVWASYAWDPTWNTADGIKAAYASAFTVTRDEIPSLR